MPDDRFSEAEIRQVFEQAAAAQARAGQTTSDGLTLDEMAEVGEASGIPRAFVEAAARSVRRGAPESRRMQLGPVPTGVFRSVPLAAPPSDALWARLVADARRTFDARGRSAEPVGAEREWRNGNLRMTLEPAGDGSRLTLRSDRLSSTSGLLLAATTQIAVALLLLSGVAATDDGAPLVGMGVALLMVAVVLATTAWARQRTWTAARESQMERLTERAMGASEQAAAGTTEAAPAAIAPASRLRDAPRLDLDALGEAPGTLDAPAPRRTRA